MVYMSNKLFVVEYHGGVLESRLWTVMGGLNFIMSKNPKFDIIVVKKSLKTRTYASQLNNWFIIHHEEDIHLKQPNFQALFLYDFL